MMMRQPAPFVRVFIEVVDEAIREQSPRHGMSAVQRTWLACCITAGLVTNAMCWARVARARLGTYALAALSWMFRHSKMPWDEVLDRRFQALDDGRQRRHTGFEGTDIVLDRSWGLVPQLLGERTLGIHGPRCYATWTSAGKYFSSRLGERLPRF
jgi:hypothetical protein